MKKIFKSRLLIQVVVASMVATLATAGIVGAATTIGANINTAGTLAVTGASTFTASSTVNGIIMDTNKFVVEDDSGNTTIGGTLGVTGALSFANASSTGTLSVATINSTTGAISFDNENLTTTGTLAAGALVTTGNVGAASSTPMANLSVGAGGTASSTISMGKFCMYAGQEDGVNVYVILGANQPANQPFATTTVSCF